MPASSCAPGPMKGSKIRSTNRKGCKKKRLFGEGGGSGEACPKGGCVKKTKKNKKAKRNPKKQEKKDMHYSWLG